MPSDGLVDAPSSIIELDNGRLFLACEVWKAWDDTSPLHIKGFAVFSEDGGTTWKDQAFFPSASMYSHTRYTRMKNGGIVGLQWAQVIATESNLDLHLTTSDVNGSAGNNPHSTGIPAQTSWMVDAGEDLFVAAYTRRGVMEPGIYATYSTDRGLTWDLDNHVLVWDAWDKSFLE